MESHTGDRYGSLLTGMRRARPGSWMHGIHLVIRRLSPLVRSVLARGIALPVESGVIHRPPDSPCNLTRACYDSGPTEA
jgi:hypothetical protein